MSKTNSQPQQHSEMQTLREELQLYRFYVRNEGLREEIKQWIAEAAAKDAGTLQEHLREQMMELQREYEMRWSPELQQGAEGFPDACSSCEHYGKACPIITDRERKITRERRLAEADTEAEARVVWQDEAVQTGCNLIPEWLEEWSSEIGPFVARGHELLEQVEDLTMDAESDMEELPEDLKQGAERDDVMALGGATGGD